MPKFRAEGARKRQITIITWHTTCYLKVCMLAFHPEKQRLNTNKPNSTNT